jgi:hypothetical protein
MPSSATSRTTSAQAAAVPAFPLPCCVWRADVSGQNATTGTWHGSDGTAAPSFNKAQTMGLKSEPSTPFRPSQAPSTYCCSVFSSVRPECTGMRGSVRIRVRQAAGAQNDTGGQASSVVGPEQARVTQDLTKERRLDTGSWPSFSARKLPHTPRADPGSSLLADQPLLHFDHLYKRPFAHGDGFGPFGLGLAPWHERNPAEFIAFHIAQNRGRKSEPCTCLGRLRHA